MNQQECWRALEQGETLADGLVRYKNINGGVHGNWKGDNWLPLHEKTDQFFDNKSIKIAKPWYNNITKSIFCWVSDGPGTLPIIALIGSHKDNCFISEEGTKYYDAVPCNKEDVLAFILGE
jgi:hypothetical protein